MNEQLKFRSEKENKEEVRRWQSKKMVLSSEPTWTGDWKCYGESERMWKG
jgi:hypothetical protein